MAAKTEAPKPPKENEQFVFTIGGCPTDIMINNTRNDMVAFTTSSPMCQMAMSHKQWFTLMESGAIKTKRSGDEFEARVKAETAAMLKAKAEREAKRAAK